MSALTDVDPRKTDRFALDGMVPARACAPRSVAALAALHEHCTANGHAIVVFGGSTLQGIGLPPERYDLAISMDRLNRVIEHEPRDLTIAVGAGMSVHALARLLAKHGQFVPFDAPRALQATVGGTLATGWAGPRRARYGRIRDFVIGTTAVLADGTIAAAGGMVVKNVSGYDMSKLYVGSLGTLATLARVNLKTFPIAPCARVAVAPLPERTRARALDHLAHLDVPPTAVLAISGYEGDIDGADGPQGRLFILIEGSDAIVERATRAMRSALGAAGVPDTRLIDATANASFARLLDAHLAAPERPCVVYRCAHLPSDVEVQRDHLEDAARRHMLRAETIADAWNGDLTARVSSDDDSLAAVDRFIAFESALRAHAPRAMIVAGSADLRRALDPWGAPPASIVKMRALKERFDPRKTLNPGRYVGRI